MLEIRSVRDPVGNHTKNWFIKTGTRFANARDATKDRGLTRLEATLYCGKRTDGVFIKFQDFMGSLKHLFPPGCIFSALHRAMWKAYTDNVKHDENKNRISLFYTTRIKAEG